jgi:hypothetical protein
MSDRRGAVPEPNSAKLLHPASRFEAHVLSVEALADIAAGLARVERSVPPRPSSSPASPRSIRLLGTAAYDVWLITWPPETGMGDHDHGGSASVLQVVSGELVEILAEVGDEAGPGRARALRPGCSTTMRPSQSHELWNPHQVDATSVHVYSPPLEMVAYSGRPARTLMSNRPRSLDRHAWRDVPGSPEGPGDSRRRVKSFAGVAAEATSPNAIR